MEFTTFDIIGYLASFIVLLSFLMKDMKTLRIVSIIGCLCFIVYGFMAETTLYPVVITNSAITVVNVYYLLKRRK